jgi:hypothetical protein
MRSRQESRQEAFAKQEDGDGSPAMLARPSQEHLDAAAKFQLALQRQRSGQLPATSAPAPGAATTSSRHPFLGRQSPTVKAEARCTRQSNAPKRVHGSIVTVSWLWRAHVELSRHLCCCPSGCGSSALQAAAPNQHASDTSTATAMQRPLNQLSADASVSGGTEPHVRRVLPTPACSVNPARASEHLSTVSALKRSCAMLLPNTSSMQQRSASGDGCAEKASATG